MSRFLLVALVAITGAFGLLMENDWLLLAAGGFFVLALVVLISLAVRRRSRRAQRRVTAERTREQELRELGISDVRPKGGTGTPSETVPPPVLKEAPEPPRQPAAADEPVAAEVEDDDLEEEEVVAEPLVEEMSGGVAATPEDGPLPQRGTEGREDPLAALQVSEDHPIWQHHSPTAFASFLRACWAATEAQTALIAAAESDGSYTLLSVRSHLPSVRLEGRIPGDSFLHIAPPERPITVLEANDPLVRDLPYYKSQMNVGGVAILPVHSDDATLFLAVDLPPDQPVFTARQRTLLQSFADLLRTLVAHPLEEPLARGVPTRRAIIGEEMEHARAEDRPLALALVYRVDAETVAQQGATAVAEAERELRLLLEDLVHHGRLERFGELMFGAFLHDEKAILEDWADRVQERADSDGFAVAIGVARLGSHRDADELRADAANALAEALQTQERVVFARPRLR